MKRSFLFVNCNEAKHICDKKQYGEANGWERLKLSIRLSYCRITRSYSKNNAKLTDAVKDFKANCLKNAERNTLKKTFDKELVKYK